MSLPALPAVKYCRREHNIALGCDTLLLGTFRYYRQFEAEMNPFSMIKDASEAMRRVTSDSHGMVCITPQEYLELGLGELHPFGATAIVEDANSAPFLMWPTDDEGN